MQILLELNLLFQNVFHQISGGRTDLFAGGASLGIGPRFCFLSDYKYIIKPVSTHVK